MCPSPYPFHLHLNENLPLLCRPENKAELQWSTSSGLIFTVSFGLSGSVNPYLLGLLARLASRPTQGPISRVLLLMFQRDPSLRMMEIWVPKGAIMVNCNNREGPWQTNPIILVKTQYQDINHGFHMSFRKPISGTLRGDTLEVSNESAFIFPLELCRFHQNQISLTVWSPSYLVGKLGLFRPSNLY